VATDDARPSVFEAVGGEPAFLRLATAHHERCLADPLLNHPFSHPGNPDHVSRLASYWAEVFGGPPRFSEQCGTQVTMLTMHSRTDAESAMGTRFVACFVAAADDAGLPPDPQLRAVLRDYMEWAVADVMSYAPHDAVVPAVAAVPRWSWDGLVSA
jgi:hemoglobin